MGILLLLPTLLMLAVLGLAVVSAARGGRDIVARARTRSPVPTEYQRLRRQRRLKYLGFVAIVAAIGCAWAWALRDPVVDPNVWGWF